jgi:ADP-ribose pyrophosphatase YjhB (NUDIX family)
MAMKHSYSAGGVIIGPNRQVLVVSQHGTSWSLPKGTLEKGEDNKTAAIREIKEETGVTQLNFIKELGSYDRTLIGLNGGEDPSQTKTITMYLITTSEEELRPIDPHNPEARWVEPGKVEDLLTHSKDKAFYRSVLGEVKALLNKK